MSISDFVNKGLNAAKGVAGGVVSNAGLITDVLKSQFTTEGLKAIMSGELFLSEQALDRELQKRLGKESKVTIEQIRCLEDRIEASAIGAALTAKVKGDYQVRIDDLRFDQKTQHLRMSMLSETYQGDNFLGCCALSVGGWFLKSLLRSRVKKSELSEILEFENDNKVILKLGELDAIKRLTTEIVPGSNISALNLLQCSGARHVMKGIQIRLTSDGLSGLLGTKQG